MATRHHVGKLNLLSARQVQTVRDGDHGDGAGLYLRVTGDSVNWIYRFTSASGRRREMGLGACIRNNSASAGQSLRLARELANEARSQLARGIDPIDNRKQIKEAAVAADVAAKADAKAERATLARVARHYHERIIEPSRSGKHAAQWLQTLETHVPAKLWHAPIASIQAPALLDAMLVIFKKVPETGSRIRQRLEAVFDDAEFRGLCHGNPARAIRRKIREAQIRRERGQFAALPYSAAPEFVERLRGQEGIAARALEFAALTAARTGEVIGAKWKEFDLDAGVWTVPAGRMKGGAEHKVYLSQRALEVLSEMQMLEQPYVFPSPALDGEGLSNMAMLTLLRRMDADKTTTVHGLCRATFSTWANETGMARKEVIEACLAHREADLVSGAYNRAQFAKERAALLAQWAQFLSRETPESNVVELRAAG